MALHALQSHLPVVRRSTEGQVGPRSYKYADLADIMAAIQPLLTQHGLVYVVQPRQADRGDHYEIVGRLIHAASGDELEASLPLTGGISPQQIGAALTYARRYLLSCLTGLITDEDPDGRGTTSEVTRGTPAADPEEVESARLLAAQETVAANWTAGGHGEWNLQLAAEAWSRWGATSKPIHEGSPEQLEAFAKWLVTTGHAQQGGQS